MMEGLEERAESILGYGGVKKDILFIAVSAVALFFGFFLGDDLPFDPSWIAIILCGVPIMIEAAVGLITRFDIKADVLVSIALIASIYIGELFAAGEIAVIMQLGSLLEDLTVAKANAGVEKLVKMTPRTARIITSDGETTVVSESVRIGDIVRVLPGEIIPVDGTIVTGMTSVDQSAVTGEPMPVDKVPGEKVYSGTMNQYGSIDIRADKVGKDSTIQRMAELVKSADAGKAKIVRFADRIATWVVIIAVAGAIVTYLLTGELIRAVTILVVFCPCSLVLATPTAVIAAISNVSKHGFLVREGDALERLSSVDTVTFDKTGTLTCGVPKVSGVISCSRYNEDDIYRWAASVERHSEHPLGKAIADGHTKITGTFVECTDFTMIPGEGVSGTVEGHMVSVGNPRMMERLGVDTDMIRSHFESAFGAGSTLIYVSIDGDAAGGIVMTDMIRSNANVTVSTLKDIGIRPVLMTGDNDGTAREIARIAGIEEIHSECLPEDKLSHISEYQESGCKVCMVGDGLNDAPALKKADVGIAMAGIGSDIATEAADIALISDDIREIPHLMRMSRRMMRTIKINITFAMGLNFLAMGLAAAGILGPVVGALIHNAGSVLVIINSASLMLVSSKNEHSQNV